VETSGLLLPGLELQLVIFEVVSGLPVELEQKAADVAG